MDHDQLLKKVVKRFFDQFMEMFFAAWAAKFDCAAAEWSETELFTTAPAGDRFLLDLVAKVRLRAPDPADPEAGASLVVVHVEIESADRTTRLRARMPSYYVHLRETHGLPVLPVVMYTNVGLEGMGRETIEEWVAGEVVAMFHHWYVGLPRLDAVQYVEGEELLGVALTPLMRMPADRVAQIGADAIQRVATAHVSDADRELLADCIKAYLPVTEATAHALHAILNKASYREAKAMNLTFREEGVLEGRRQATAEAERKGLFKAIGAVLDVRFGAEGLAFVDEIAHMTDTDKLDAILIQAKRVPSLEALREFVD